MATHTGNKVVTALPTLPTIKTFAAYSIGSYTFKMQNQAGFVGTLLQALNSGGTNNCWIGSGGLWIPAKIF
jgi:hypothetical protein